MELEQDTGLQSSVNERELTKQIKKLTNQYNQQITVNKTFSRTVSTDEGTREREGLTTTEREGGATVSVDRLSTSSNSHVGEIQEARERERLDSNTFVSDSGLQITEL